MFTYNVIIDQGNSERTVTWFSILEPDHFLPERVFGVEGVTCFVRETHQRTNEHDPFDAVILATEIES